jgi:hypothetical protein
MSSYNQTSIWLIENTLTFHFGALKENFIKVANLTMKYKVLERIQEPQIEMGCH